MLREELGASPLQPGGRPRPDPGGPNGGVCRVGGRRGSGWEAVAGALLVPGWVWLKALWLKNGPREARNGPELWARLAEGGPSPQARSVCWAWNPSCKCFLFLGGRAGGLGALPLEGLFVLRGREPRGLDCNRGVWLAQGDLPENLLESRSGEILPQSGICQGFKKILCGKPKRRGVADNPWLIRSFCLKHVGGGKGRNP